jgi:Holliday junction DNA helicase RuvA
MIAQIRGRLASKEPHRVVVDVNGVGYQIFIPLSTYYQLPEVPAEVSCIIALSSPATRLRLT